jgi:hypothetical protein
VFQKTSALWANVILEGAHTSQLIAKTMTLARLISVTMTKDVSITKSHRKVVLFVTLRQAFYALT